MFSFYYKFLDNAGLGLSSLTSKQNKMVCSSVNVDYSCKNYKKERMTLKGIFLLIGYDFI